MTDKEYCKCGHNRIRHKISDSSCKDCNCEYFQWDKIKEIQVKYCERCKQKTIKLEKFLGMIVCKECVEELK